MKTCAGCHTIKPLSAFGDSAYTRKDGTRTPLSRCRECRREYMAEYDAQRPEARRAAQLKRYGLSQDDYDQMVEAQYGLCVICLNNRPLQVDHDHADGQVRQLICGPCNRMLGCAGDKADVLERGAIYLREARALKETV